MISTPRIDQSDRALFLLLLLAALLLFCSDLGGVPLRDWDEGTVAQVAREISQGQTWQAWLHPQLWGDPYLNKPPLMHGLIALAYRLWGVHTWTARLPGAVLTALSVPLLYVLGRDLFPTRLLALLGTVVYLTLLPVVRHGRLAMLDGAVVCFFIVTLWMLRQTLARDGTSTRSQSYWHIGVGVGFALMCLTKGMLGLLLLAIALLFVAWAAPRQVLSSRLWIGILVGSLPVLGWYGLQWHHYGQRFVETTLMSQSFERIWNTVERHDEPFWYYLLELLKYSWPWLVFWPTGVWLTWRSRHQAWAKLLLVWTGGYVLAISVMGTKLPWYIFPLYPAISLVCGVALAAAWDMHRHWNRRSLAIKQLPRIWSIMLALLSVVGAAGVVYASPWGGEPSIGLGLTFAIVMVATGLAAFFIHRQQLRFVPILVVGMYGALLCLMVSDYWLWELGEDFPVLPVAQLVRQHTPPGQVVYTSHDHDRPSLNFYSDRQVIAQSAATLQQQWQQAQSAAMYLLVREITPYQDAQGQVNELGNTEDWHLLLKRPQPKS